MCKGIALFKKYLTLFFHRASGGGRLATAVSVQDQRMDWPVVPCPVQKDNNIKLLTLCACPIRIQ